MSLPRLTIRKNNDPERINIDTLVELRSRVSLTCEDDDTSDSGSISLINHVERELASASEGVYTINSMSLEDQGAYRCSVESQSVDVAVISELNALSVAPRMANASVLQSSRVRTTMH